MIKRLLLAAILILSTYSLTHGANYWLRPKTGGPYGTSAGTSYANAFYLDSQIAALPENSTLYVIGDRKTGYNDKQIIVPKSGITIDGADPDHPAEPGRIFSASIYYPASGWSGPDGSGAYYRSYTGGDTRQYFEDISTAPVRLTNATSTATLAAGGAYVNTTTHFIYYKPTSGAANSHTFSVGDTNQSIYLNGKSNCTIKNMTAMCSARGIYVLNGAGSTTIADNTVKWQKSNGIQIGSGAVGVPGCNTGTCSGNTVTYCANGIYFVSSGTIENSNYWTVRNNDVSNIDQDDFYLSTDAGGINVQGGSHNVFTENEVSDCAGSGITFWVDDTDHACSYNIVSRNFIHDIEDLSTHGRNQRGLEFSPDNPTAQFDKDQIVGNQAYYNLIVNAHNIGIRSKAIKPTTGYSWRYINNVVVNCTSSLVLNLTATSYTHDGQFYNNISFNPTVYHWEDTISAGSRPDEDTINYNLYYPDTGSKFRWNSVNYAWAAWKTAADQGSNDPTPADPRFINASGNYGQATDFEIRQSSPAFDKGRNLGLALDYFGQAVYKSRAPDCGIFEVQAPSRPVTRLTGMAVDNTDERASLGSNIYGVYIGVAVFAGDTTKAVTLTGMSASAKVFTTKNSTGDATYVKGAVASADTVTVTMSGPTTGEVSVMAVDSGPPTF